MSHNNNNTALKIIDDPFILYIGNYIEINKASLNKNIKIYHVCHKTKSLHNQLIY